VKNTPSKYVVNQNLENIDEISFREFVIDSVSQLRRKLYDKRDDFKITIDNFPFICSNIPATPRLGVFTS
jgi:hypothetical protein